MLKKLSLVGGLLLAFSGLCFCQTDLDPATLHIGNGASGTCATGYTGTAPCNTKDPFDMVSTSMVSVFQESGANSLVATSSSPLTIAILVPSSTSITNLQLTGATFYDSNGNSLGTGSAVSSSQSTYSGGDFYKSIGATHNGDGSMSISNLGGASGDSGTTSFTVYTFNIVGCQACVIGPKGFASFNFNQSLPQGAIIAALGYDSNGTQYTVAWTNAGFIDSPVPEPSALLLLGSGLSVIGIAVKRRT